MKYTNKLNLPQVFINYYEGENKHKEFDPLRFSVTELLNPTKIIILSRLHRDEIHEDISECIPAIFGTAVHSIFEKNTPKNTLAEYKISHKIGLYTLSGIIDNLDLENAVITDYKTSTTSHDDSDGYYKQGMMYAWMVYNELNVKIRQLKFYVLLKDWSKVKASSNSSYPQAPIKVVEFNIEDSDYIYIESFIKDKLKDIEDGIKDCSDEERWFTGDKYAVYKKETDARATIVCDTEEEAKGYIENKLNGAGIIQKREGDNMRCRLYCKLKEWCSQCKN